MSPTTYISASIALSACIFVAHANAANPPAQRPNILFIMSDDHASHSLSTYGSKINQTPHLDKIAADGIRFNNAFVTNSICTPSRATVLTGKYSHKNGTHVFNAFNGEQQTVSKILREAGYYTAMVGKWHLGTDPTGFDYWNILPGQGAYNNPSLYTAEGDRVYFGHASKVLTDIGIETLKNRPKDKPFFLMLHHKAPHRNWIPDPENAAKFADRVIPEPETLFDDYSTRPAALPSNKQTVRNDLHRGDLKIKHPEGLDEKAIRAWYKEFPKEVEITENGVQKTLVGDELFRWKYQRYMRDYLACVQGMDDQIGRLREWLKSEGLEENTLIIYTTDNGFFLGDKGMYDKRFMYEQALRIPLLVSWPKVIKPGQSTDLFALNVDYAPTFLDAAGVQIPADMQGRSLLPIFKGETPDQWRKSMYYRYYHDPGHHNTRAHYGVRTQTHKLIYFWKIDQWELFDLVNDPNEQKNIYDQPEAAEIQKSLKAELAKLRTELQDEDQLATEVPKDAVDAHTPKWQPGQGPKGPL